MSGSGNGSYASSDTESSPRELVKALAQKSGGVPQHVAIIMDGNGRWAKKRFLPRVAGHKAGAKTVRTIVEEARRSGVRYLTLYSFSSENWLRPEAEVSALMSLFCEYLGSELETLTKNDIRLRAIGDLARLPSKVQEALNDVMQKTKNCEGMDLVLAVSYGAREEITQAVRRVAEAVEKKELSSSEISEADISNNLYAPDIPDPDLLIRTSDECRISNFLLWQLAYSEIVVSPQLWPDFSKEEFHRCLQEYGSRVRRFGLTDEQLATAVK